MLFESVLYLELKERLKGLPDDGWVKISTLTDEAGRGARRKVAEGYASTGSMASSMVVAINFGAGVSVDWSTVHAATNHV